MNLVNRLQIVKDSCDGFYQDLAGEEVEVLEYETYEGTDENEMFYVVATNRPSNDPYNEGESIEMVWSGDTKAISYIEA